MPKNNRIKIRKRINTPLFPKPPIPPHPTPAPIRVPPFKMHTESSFCQYQLMYYMDNVLPPQQCKLCQPTCPQKDRAVSNDCKKGTASVLRQSPFQSYFFPAASSFTSLLISVTAFLNSLMLLPNDLPISGNFKPEKPIQEKIA